MINALDMRAAVIIAGHVFIFSGIAARRWPRRAARMMRVGEEHAVRAARFLRLCLMWTGVSVMTARIILSLALPAEDTLWAEAGILAVAAAVFFTGRLRYAP